MAKIKVEEIKEGIDILINGQKCNVKKFEKSNIGKFGKVKCRIEAVNENKEDIVIIRLANDFVEKV